MKFVRFNGIGGVANRKTLTPCAVSFISVTLLLIVTRIHFVGSIMVPELWEIIEEDYGDRELINLQARKSYESTRELSRTIRCVESFVKIYLNVQPSQIPVLLPENMTNSLRAATRLYLSALHDIKSTYVLSGYLDPSSEHIASLTALIIVEDSAQLSNTTSQLIDLCGRDCQYLVVLTTAFPDKESFLEESSKMVQTLWIGRIANVVFLGTIGQTVFASRSLSFRHNITSTPSDPDLMAECGEHSNWTDVKGGTDVNMYSLLKMNKCIVHVAFFDYEPYVSVKRKDKHLESTVSSLLTVISTDNVTSVGVVDDSFDTDNGNTTTTTTIEVTPTELIGIEAEVVKALAASLDFAIAVKEIPWKNISIGEEVNEALWGQGMEEVDMVLGGLLWAPKNETDYTLPYEIIQIVWVIPIHSHVSLHGLVGPLQNNVWFAVIGLLVFAGCIEMIFTRNISFLEIFSLVIGIAWPRQPSILSGRIRFISWVIFGYVLTQCYLASLSGQLMASSSLQIETLKELTSSSLTIGGSQSTKDLFEYPDQHDLNEAESDVQDDDDDDDDEINRIMMEKFNVFDHDKYAKNFNDLINERNQSLALAVTMNVSSVKPSFVGKNVHRMREALASFPLSFAVWRGMPYLRALDKKISILIEGGIIGYWAKRISQQYGHYTDLHNDEANLRLSALVPGFLLLTMGYGIAVLSLIFEIAIFSWLNRSRTTKRRRKQNKISQEKSKPRPIPIKIVRNKEKKLPETLDTRAWIIGFNDWHQDVKRDDRKPLRRTNYPFEFVH